MKITRQQAQDWIDEVALSPCVTEEDISFLRERIPSDNPNITPLLEELSSIYFLTQEVLDHYTDKLFQMVNG